jgi:glycosyltransferase involved in cell wall biosynthesis
MRILIDLQGAQNGSRDRGIGRYSMALAKAIARNAGPHEVFVLLNGLFANTISPIRASFEGVLPNDRFLVFSAPGPVDELRAENTWRRQSGEFLREHLINSFGPDALLISSLVEGAEDDTLTSIGRLPSSALSTVVLYDLIPLTDPDRYIGWEPARNWYHGKMDSMRRADFLFAISESAAKEAITLLETDPTRVSNISSAVDGSFRPDAATADDIAQVARKFGIKRKYLMHSSAFDPRKNFQGLIRAFAEIPKAERAHFQLVLVCKLNDTGRSELQELASASGLGADELVLTGFVSDAELIALYCGCHLFVFPSFHEGFGLPALEAMCCGAPAIGSNLTSIPEVIGREDALFDPTSTESMAGLIKKALTEPAFHDSLRAHARAQARKFSWDKTALRVIDGLERLHSTRDRQPLVADTPTQRLKDLTEAVAALAESLKPSDEDLLKLAQCVAANENAVARLRASAAYSGPLTWRLEGPFDSTYSLALLNRETARALSELGHTVVLHSTEGPGDFPANPAFLAQNPDLAAMHARVADHPHEAVDAVSRNLYPPRVQDMSSKLNMLHHYAWEESRFPAEWVDSFNAHLDGLTCLSTHVKDVLLNSGVTVPMATSGCGVDHWERIEPSPHYRVVGRGFRFLHVSSCFPRKGVDVLLDAFGKVFTAKDDVTLIIKTFANPHNEIHSMLAQRRSANPAYPDVQVIEGDLSDEDLKALYQQCHALVAPSRAEGFGLPMAEAMLSGLPVITTGWGGQLDFCNEQTAWLVDYKFARAQTHFKLFDSAWADPDVDALARTMASVHSAPARTLQAKVAAGRTQLLNGFTWQNVAARLVDTALDLRTARAQRNPVRIGWVTTWNTKCGIASYSEHLIAQMPGSVTVLAPQQGGRIREDGPNCVRCWRSDKDENNFDELSKQLAAQGSDVVVVQFNYAFYNFRLLADFLERQVDDGRIVIVMMHATKDPGLAPEWNWSIATLAPALTRCHRVLVHTVDDLNRLKDLGLVRNVALFPHGVLDVAPLYSSTAPGKVPLIATYGYCLPHKGLQEMIQAVAALRDAGTPVRLRLVNAEYPDKVSAVVIEEIRSLIKRLALSSLVEAHHSYLEDAESLRLLQDADLIVYAYQGTNESASGAVRYGLATHRPVAVTPLAIFDDLGGAVHRFGGTSPKHLAEGIASVLDKLRQNAGADEVATEAERWRTAHSYRLLGKRLFNICASLAHDCPREGRVLAASGPRLRTAVGRVQGHSITTTGSPGFLLFGPYLTLPMGSYEITLEGQCLGVQGARAHVEVVVDGGHKILAKCDLDGSTATNEIARMRIKLDQPCRDLEVRVAVDAAFECSLDWLKVAPVPNKLKESLTTDGFPPSSGAQSREDKAERVRETH